MAEMFDIVIHFTICENFPLAGGRGCKVKIMTGRENIQQKKLSLCENILFSIIIHNSSCMNLSTF
jgi:hypothetical protein